MLIPFTCGTFHPEGNQDELRLIGSSPRRSFARWGSFYRTNNKYENPYSTRGLDKFEALLTELEEKKKEIYTRSDPNDISFIRFAYKSSNGFVPIVVKLKDKNSPSRSSPSRDDLTKHRENLHQTTSLKHDDDEPIAIKADNKKHVLSLRSLSLDQWRKPSVYMPVTIVLILVCLLFFGRSVAIMCTSIGWYVVPLFSTSGSEKIAKSRKQKQKKKELLRRSSENKIKVTRRHKHQRSW